MEIYESTSHYDDLAYAAVWLHIRTDEAPYKEAAMDFYQKHQEDEGGGNWKVYGWDGNGWGAAVWLSRYVQVRRGGAVWEVQGVRLGGIGLSVRLLV